MTMTLQEVNRNLRDELGTAIDDAVDARRRAHLWRLFSEVQTEARNDLEKHVATLHARLVAAQTALAILTLNLEETEDLDVDRTKYLVEPADLENLRLALTGIVR